MLVGAILDEAVGQVDAIRQTDILHETTGVVEVEALSVHAAVANEMVSFAVSTIRNSAVVDLACH